MIDLHGHYLPWVGDGAGSLDEALLMLRMAEADGVRFAVLTPSVDPRRSPVSRSELEKKFAAFAQLVHRRGIDVQLRLGAELVHGPGAIEIIDRRELPFIGEWEGRQVALLRWAEDFIPIGAISVTQDMLARGVLPMLAHPERNPGVVRAPSTLELFLCDGCLVQVDAGSVLGWHGPEVRDTAFRLIEAGMATVLASAATDTGSRPPMLRAARDIVAQRFGEEIATRLVELNPSLVVAEDLARGRTPEAVQPAPLTTRPVQPVRQAAVAATAAAAATAATTAATAATVIDSAPMVHARPPHPPPVPAPLHALGIRGEARGAGIGRGRSVPAGAQGAERPRHHRQARSAAEPVIAPADPRLPLMRF